MGQQVSITCPVCKERKATYKDVFKAICPDLNTYYNYQRRYPPFEKFLGPDCLKYMYKSYPLRWERQSRNTENTQEPYVYWMFYSCDNCIRINDPNRPQKFSEYNPSGVTMWHSQLP